MALSDDDLLDFDLTRLAHLDVPPRTLLAQHGDHYRSQLRIAHWLDGWRERLEADQSFLSDDKRKAGASDALREVAAHLRQGDFLPGGTLYEDEESG
jgi:hypothetical protein